jgi:glycine/D-amino acid oxidase-like deaminating enzyme
MMICPAPPNRCRTCEGRPEVEVVDYRTKSFWLSAAPYEPSPPLKGDIAVDVAIVGGGFTGLSAALHLREAQALDVAVLESEVVGFGASGRNGGFAMTLFGLTMSLTGLRFGKAKAKEAHLYMERAVDYVGELVEKHGIDSEYERTGFLRVATAPGYVRRIQKEIKLAHALGIEGIDWLDAQQTAERVRSPLYLGAWWEPRCALINPAKQAWGLKGAAEARGARFFEHTPTTSITRTATGVILRTPGGTVRAKKLVLATNAYSHLIPGLRHSQVPAFTHIVLTEPLTPERLAPIGWRGREGIEDARNLVHYYRLTSENRLLMGGGNIATTYGENMDRDLDSSVFGELERHIQRLYPSLRGVRITHRWGGPVSVPMDMAPAMGFLGDERVVYSLGCMGHGVSLTHLNGRAIADLVLGRRSDLTSVFFVNRRTLPWPPEPLRLILSQAIRGYLHAEDAWYDRRTPKGTAAIEPAEEPVR